MINFIIDHTPWWVLLIIGMAVVGGVFAFFAPVLLPLWAMVPKPVKMVIGAVIGLVLAFVAGRNKGVANEQQREKERDAEAVKRRSAIDREVANLDDTTVDKRLDKWMRD